MMGTLTVLCYIQLAVVAGVFWDKKKGEVLPNDPKVWAEGALMLNCSVTDMSISMESKMLYFKWNNTHILEQYITRSENKRYIELKLQNMRMEDEGTYYCNLNDTIIASQFVKIYRKPVPVENITCMVYDWASMKCSWDLGVHYHYPKLINVSVVWLIDYPGANQYECTRLTNTSCTWKENDGLDSFKPDMTYIFLVIVKNIVMENSTQKTLAQRIDTRAIVKPAAVRDLKSAAKNSTCMTVTFKNEKPERKKHCVIQLHSKWNYIPKVPDQELFTDSTSIQRITVCGLHPSAQYHINVRCRPRNHGKFFSDQTTTEHMMPEDVPSIPPELNVGSFKETAYLGNDLRKVTVYWKPIPEEYQNGRITSHELMVNGKTFTFKDVEINQGSVNLSLDQDYEIKVRAHTEIGPSSYSLPLYVKSKISKPDKPAWFYVVGVNASTVSSSSFKVQLHWEKPASGWEVVKKYTLYYCQGWTFNQTCKGKSSSLNGSLTWLNVSPDATNHTLNLPGTAEGYLFGISADTPTFSSGLLWSSCTYYNNKAPDKSPQSFEFSEVKGDLSLTVQWEKYKCEESSPVLWYTVRYCLVEKITDEPICKGQIIEKKATADQSSNTLDDLEADRTYAVSLQAMTTAGSGPETAWIYSSAISIATRLSTGEIVGICIGCLVVLSFALVGCIVFGRRMRKTMQGPPEDSIIMPPPLPDFLDSYTEGSHQYALCASPESPTSRTSLLSNGNSSLTSNGSNSTGLADETAKIFNMPSGNGFISNGSARSLDKIKLPEKKKGKNEKNPIPEGYTRISNLSSGSSGSNGSQTSPNNMLSPVVKPEQDSVVMFIVDNGKLTTSDQFFPLNGKCKSPVSQYQKNVMNHIETRGDTDNGLDSRGRGQSSQSMNHIGSYTMFTDGFSSNCIGSAISLASSGGVLRHSPPPERCASTDQGLSDYEQPIRAPLSTSTPIPRLSFLKCHQSADSELECFDQPYVQCPPQTLDSRSLPSILECVGPSSFTRRNSDGESTLSACSGSAKSLHFSETETNDQKSSFPMLIADANGYVHQPDGTLPSYSLAINSEPTVVSSTADIENNYLVQVPGSSSSGFVSNIPASESPDDSPSTNISYSGSDAASSAAEYISIHHVDPVATTSDVISNKSIETAFKHIKNDSMSVPDLHISSTGYVAQNPAVLLNGSCEYSPDGSVSDSGLDNSLPDVVALSGGVANCVPENAHLSEDQSNTVVLPSSGYLPNNSNSQEVRVDLPKIVEPNVEHTQESSESLEPSGLGVIEGYLHISDMTVGHSNTNDTLPSTPITCLNSKSDLSKLSCSSVVRPISNYMKDLPVQYFCDPQAMEDLPTTEL